MMRHFSSFAVAFVLASCGSVLSQQRLLVQHNDVNDPCGRFKMRILIPADVVDHKLPAKEFAGGIDSKMVWNPCAKTEVQLAFVPPVSFPATKNLISPEFPFSFQHRANQLSKPDDIFLTPSPSVLRFTRPQPRNQ